MDIRNHKKYLSSFFDHRKVALQKHLSFIYRRMSASLLESYLYAYIALQYQFILTHFIYCSFIVHQRREEMNGSSFNTHLQFVRHIMASEDYAHLTEAQRQEILQRRVKKFYCTQETIRVDQQHFKPRIEPIYLEGIETSNDTLILFGIDFLKKSELKQMFKEFTTQYYFIDQSNCMIYFESPFDAMIAIKALVKQDSPTKMKIQQDQQLIESQGAIKVPPKAWIQLRPYIYTHLINKFTKQEYKRRLHVRFATSQEKQFGINKETYLDFIFKTCQRIWESGIIKQNMKMRVLLQRKIERIKKAKEQQQKGRGMGKSKYGHQNKGDKSYMQEQVNGGKSSAYFDCNQKPIPSNVNSGKSKLRQRLNDDIGLQIRSRSDASDYQHMVSQLQELRLFNNTLNGSFFHEANKTVENNHQHPNNQHNTSYILEAQSLDNVSKQSDISYKVVQPAQIKLNASPHNSFNYKQYLNNTIQEEERIKKIQCVDLTDL